MNIKKEFKDNPNFVEVIYASLDGKIYFMDLFSGEPSRDSININNPIKGSVSVDPRGYPLLYVGQGINESGEIGYRIFSLIDGELLYFLNGNDGKAKRAWGAFDGSALINKETDTLVIGGENGLLYSIKLNTEFSLEKKSIKVNPEIIKYSYEIKGNNYQGIENSVTVYKNLAFFADNGGGIQCVDLNTMKPLWIVDGIDDTDATLVIEDEKGVPFIYTANEVDKQGTKGFTYIRKINGFTGKVVFEKPFEAMSLLGEHPVNGGVLATPVMGKKSIDNLVIFTIARYKKFDSGLMVALNKESGEEVWRLEMKNYAWSSPVDIYDEDGNGHIIQCDSASNLFLINGNTGEILDQIHCNNNIESSPAVYNNMIVVAERFGNIYGISIE
jgi:outer membrane protein assembly factor BamB